MTNEVVRLWDYIDENHGGSASVFARSIGKFRQEVNRWNCKFKPPEHKGRWHSAIVKDGSIWVLCNFKRKDYKLIEVNGVMYRHVFTLECEK